MRNAVQQRKGERGMSMIELMISIVVLSVGMAGLMVLFGTAAMTNSRSKNDTTATMLAQTVLDQMAALPASSNATFTITDCTGANFTVATTGSANPGTGATIVAATGNIDFTQALNTVPANYSMQYSVCGPNGQRAAYDVRWNVITVTANTRMITVSARQTTAGSTGANRALLYMQPITLRTIAGM